MNIEANTAQDEMISKRLSVAIERIFRNYIGKARECTIRLSENRISRLNKEAEIPSFHDAIFGAQIPSKTVLHGVVINSKFICAYGSAKVVVFKKKQHLLRTLGSFSPNN